MARVEASTLIRAPLDHVYAVAKRVEDFPRFMPDLERVTVLERAGDVPTATEWVGVVEGRKIHWIEDDVWDDARHVCRFRQRDGDFERYEGEWTFQPEGEGTRTAIAVEFEFGIPLIGGLLSQLLRVKMKENLDGMLAALRGQLESQR
ncbi:MAG TPA: SRPBCC family protein [bacterium]|nr:SRPBCC family protein [bacterium]